MPNRSNAYDAEIVAIAKHLHPTTGRLVRRVTWHADGQQASANTSGYHVTAEVKVGDVVDVIRNGRGTIIHLRPAEEKHTEEWGSGA